MTLANKIEGAERFGALANREQEPTMKRFSGLAFLLCLAAIASAFPHSAFAAKPDEQISARLDALERKMQRYARASTISKRLKQHGCNTVRCPPKHDYKMQKHWPPSRIQYLRETPAKPSTSEPRTRRTTSRSADRYCRVRA